MLHDEMRVSSRSVNLNMTALFSCTINRSESKLKAVKIEKTDVDVLADQFDLPKPLAERQLRIAGGDLQAALRTLVGLAR